MSMKAKDSAWVLLAGVFSVCGVLSGCNPQRSAKAEKPRANAHPLFAPVTATLAQQKMCDEQAAKRFRELREKSGALTSYTSRYDPAVNVCYGRVYYMSGAPPMVADTVSDAFGGRIYANYMWINSQNKQSSEVPPVTCEIHIPGKPDETCNTEEEFNKLVDRYFDVAQ